MKTSLVGIIALLLAQTVIAAPLTGKVVAVHDASTLTVRQANGTKNRIRLAWIAAPHADHGCAAEGKRALGAMTLRKTVQVHLQGDTIDGAARARLEIPRDGQDALDPAAELLAKGLVTRLEQPSHTQRDTYARVEYLLMESGAQNDKRGVWGAGCTGKERGS